MKTFIVLFLLVFSRVALPASCGGVCSDVSTTTFESGAAGTCDTVTTSLEVQGTCTFNTVNSAQIVTVCDTCFIACTSGTCGLNNGTSDTTMTEFKSSSANPSGGKWGNFDMDTGDLAWLVIRDAAQLLMSNKNTGSINQVILIDTQNGLNDTGTTTIDIDGMMIFGPKGGSSAILIDAATTGTYSNFYVYGHATASSSTINAIGGPSAFTSLTFHGASAGFTKTTATQTITDSFFMCVATSNCVVLSGGIFNNNVLRMGGHGDHGLGLVSATASTTLENDITGFKNLGIKQINASSSTCTSDYLSGSNGASQTNFDPDDGAAPSTGIPIQWDCNTRVTAATTPNQPYPPLVDAVTAESADVSTPEILVFSFTTPWQSLGAVRCGLSSGGPYTVQSPQLADTITTYMAGDIPTRTYGGAWAGFHPTISKTTSHSHTLTLAANTYFCVAGVFDGNGMGTWDTNEIVAIVTSAGGGVGGKQPESTSPFTGSGAVSGWEITSPF